MKKTPLSLRLILMSILVGTFLLAPLAQAREETGYSETYYKGEIVDINPDGNTATIQLEEAEPIEVSIESFNLFAAEQPWETGDKVVVVETHYGETEEYTLVESYRLPALLGLVIGLVALAVVFAGKKGAFALVGLAATLVIVMGWIVPGVIAGKSPLLMSYTGAIGILLSSLYIAHGFTRRTSLAVVSTVITLHLALGLSFVAVELSKLMGMGSDDATSLAFGALANVDLKGLLLGAIVIGVLGVLDDITTAQTAVVAELHDANSRLSFRELYQKGLSVGKEHIASLINTLVIAYIGTAFPILLILATSPTPLWVTLNNEFMAEEIVRSLVGSMTLIVAVPISTGFAAWFYSKKRPGTQR